MKLSRLITFGLTMAAAMAATAAVHRTPYLRTFGPSPLRFAPAGSTEPTRLSVILPPLARGDEVDYPRPPHYLPLAGSALAQPEPTGAAAPVQPSADELTAYGPEPPPGGPGNQSPVVPLNLDPDDQPPAGPGLHGAPISPGTLIPFFNRPAAPPGTPVGVPLQFFPAPPPDRPARSSSATYTKQ